MLMFRWSGKAESILNGMDMGMLHSLISASKVSWFAVLATNLPFGLLSSRRLVLSTGDCISPLFGFGVQRIRDVSQAPARWIILNILFLLRCCSLWLHMFSSLWDGWINTLAVLWAVVH